jgi:hypothetical protein
MKTNDYLLLTATGAYSFLFYQQTAGLNFLIFTIVFLGVLLFRNKNLLKQKKWCWAAAMCLVSAACVFVHSSALSIIANVFSLLLVSAVSFNVVTSSLFSLLFGCFSLASSVVFMIVDVIARTQTQSENTENKRGYKIFATFIVLFLSVLFFVMYKNANPLFAENTKWINLDFISMQWIVFTLGGFILLYGLFYHHVIPPISNWENNLAVSNKLAVGDANVKQYETERFAGLLLFVLLNLMLLVLNIGDVQTLYLNGGLPKGITHSDFVHNGVGIIILSIVFATSLIMFLFRKEFTDIKNNKVLNAFVYLWIIQNIIMLSSTAFRNQIYIHDYNFTYKRIGVYVWLALAAIGLMIMFCKIYQQRSNWYLIRTNVALWFTVLTLSSCVNWDKLITNYNISNKRLADVDFYYLFSLSDTNIPELIKVTKHQDFKSLNANLKNYVGASYRDDSYYTSSYSALLSQKIDSYLSNRISSWKSYDLRDQEVYKSIYSKQ